MAKIERLVKKLENLDLKKRYKRDFDTVEFEIIGVH